MKRKRHLSKVRCFAHSVRTPEYHDSDPNFDAITVPCASIYGNIYSYLEFCLNSRHFPRNSKEARLNSDFIRNSSESEGQTPALWSLCKPVSMHSVEINIKIMRNKPMQSYSIHTKWHSFKVYVWFYSNVHHGSPPSCKFCSLLYEFNQ